MVRLGDAYSALAESPGKFRPDLFSPNEKYADPACKKCGKKMKLMQSMPRTEIMPAMQAFRCDACGKTLMWKGESSSLGQLAAGAERPQPIRDALCGYIIQAGGKQRLCPRAGD